jgi:hypothetical protein
MSAHGGRGLVDQKRKGDQLTSVLMLPEPRHTEHGITPVPLPEDTSPLHMPDKGILYKNFQYLPQISQKRKCKAPQDVRHDLLRCTATTLHTGAVLQFDALGAALLRVNTFAATVCLQLRLPCIRLSGLLSHQQFITTPIAAVPALRTCSQHSLRQQCFAVKAASHAITCHSRLTSWDANLRG